MRSMPVAASYVSNEPRIALVTAGDDKPLLHICGERDTAGSLFFDELLAHALHNTNCCRIDQGVVYSVVIGIKTRQPLVEDPRLVQPKRLQALGDPRA